MKQLRTVFLVSIALLCASLFVSPVLAASPDHKAVWNWYGSTVFCDYTFPCTEIVGANIQSVGGAFQDANNNWGGRGIFMDKDMGLRAQLTVTAGDFWTTDTKANLLLNGLADVAVGGEKIGTYDFVWLFSNDISGGKGGYFAIRDLPGYDNIPIWSLNPLSGMGFRYS